MVLDWLTGLLVVFVVVFVECLVFLGFMQHFTHHMVCFRYNVGWTTHHTVCNTCRASRNTKQRTHQHTLYTPYGV